MRTKGRTRRLEFCIPATTSRHRTAKRPFWDTHCSRIPRPRIRVLGTNSGIRPPSNECTGIAWNRPRARERARQGPKRDFTLERRSWQMDSSTFVRSVAGSWPGPPKERPPPFARRITRHNHVTKVTLTVSRLTVLQHKLIPRAAYFRVARDSKRPRVEAALFRQTSLYVIYNTCKHTHTEKPDPGAVARARREITL